MLEEGGQRPNEFSQASGAPIERLILLQALATPLKESLALALLELQFIAHETLGQGVRRNNQQVIDPEAVGGERCSRLLRQGGPREGQIGPTIAMFSPKLPPQVLAIPNHPGQGGTKALLPKRRGAKATLGWKTLDQGDLAE
jgi:hypothetical protein